MKSNDPLPKSSRFLSLASICVVIAALYFGREVLVPLALAILLTFLLAPLASRVEKLKIGRVPSVLVVVLLAFALIGGLGWAIGGQVRELADQLPTYRANIHERFESLNEHLKGLLKARKALRDATSMATSQPTTSPVSGTDSRGTPDNPIAVAVTSNVAETDNGTLRTIGNMLGFLEPLATALVVIVLVIFMLSQREDLRDRLIRLMGTGRLTVTTRALDEAASRVSKYLLAQSMINGVFAVVISIGLFFIGVPNPLLWGLLCGLLRFIPYVGVWIGAAFPILLSLVLKGAFKPLVTVGMFVTVELVTGNALEPLLYGSSTGVSSIAILVAAIFWTWLWGGVGLLLSTPLTVCLAVMGKYVPHLEFLNVLLGDQPVLEPYERFYQRLLAEDPEEATDLVDEYLKDKPLEEVYDAILLPALRMAEHEHERGNLDDRTRDSIRRNIRDLVEELHDRAAAESIKQKAAETEAAAKDSALKETEKDDTTGAPGTVIIKGPQRVILPKDCKVTVLCIPGHDDADAIAGLMFCHLLERHGVCAIASTADPLASEMVDSVEKTGADLVVISAMPPGAIAHSRYLCKRLHAKYPEIRLLVGLWTVKGDTEKAKTRIACEKRVELATHFGGALDQVHQMVQAVLASRGVNEGEQAR